MARFHGLDDNVVHMLTDCIAFVPKMKQVRDQLVTVYGPNWPRSWKRPQPGNAPPRLRKDSVPDSLPIAVRVYPDLKALQPERKAPQIDGMLVFDCETRTDKTQALTFGSYRFLVGGPGASKKAFLRG